MKVCFLLQVLVAFYELQNNFGASFSCKLNKIERDLHPSILETLNNLHVGLAPWMKTWSGFCAGQAPWEPLWKERVKMGTSACEIQSYLGPRWQGVDKSTTKFTTRKRKVQAFPLVESAKRGFTFGSGPRNLESITPLYGPYFWIQN